MLASQGWSQVVDAMRYELGADARTLTLFDRNSAMNLVRSNDPGPALAQGKHQFGCYAHDGAFIPNPIGPVRLMDPCAGDLCALFDTGVLAR